MRDIKCDHPLLHVDHLWRKAKGFLVVLGSWAEMFGAVPGFLSPLNDAVVGTK